MLTIMLMYLGDTPGRRVWTKTLKPETIYIISRPAANQSLIAVLDTFTRNTCQHTAASLSFVMPCSGRIDKPAMDRSSHVRVEESVGAAYRRSRALHGLYIAGTGRRCTWDKLVSLQRRHRTHRV